jgi:hypothetical protein
VFILKPTLHILLQVAPLEKHVLLLDVPVQTAAVNLGDMVLQRFANYPAPTVTCSACYCSPESSSRRCIFGGTMSEVFLKTSTGSLQIVTINRNQAGSLLLRVMTPVKEPTSHQAWAGKKLCAVITHQVHGLDLAASEVEREAIEASGGHYVPFIKKEDIWWKLDSGTGHIVMENPFDHQISSVHHDGYSIIIFFFK